ncbi:LuxR family transcriptional regulator [Nocardioides sp. W7]|uniref:LuxR family transcriptional regulator n=1 Tax=Nocardioides sp. W7 TaxID=2931390 RepID=UPI001FCFE9E9|nr:LuxR family transcriptional regulator [Nocardioides sp. W7]
MRSPEVPDEADLADALPSALVSVRAGRIREGLAALTALRAHPVAAVDPVAGGLIAAALLDCRLARGDVGEAIVVGGDLDALLELPGPPGALAHHARGELTTVLGQDELAVEHFTTAGERLAETEALTDPTLVPWRASAAVALVRVGRHREAVALAEEWRGVTAASGSQYAHAHALRTLAIVGVGGDRVVLLREARATLSGVVARRLAAQIDTDLAGLLLLDPTGAGTDEARDLLRSAEEYAGLEELWPLQGRVRRLLDRMGEQPHRVRSEAMATLTAAERRVALLATEGLTNRRIAEELVVTVKAVEWHLSHIYRKLGIASRSHLASTLGTPV